MAALKSVPARNEYIAISASILSPSQICGVSLYLRDGEDGTYRLFRAPNIPITQEWLHKLEADGLRKLFISEDDHQEFQKYLRQNLTALLKDDSIPISERFRSLNDVVRDVLAESFNTGSVDDAVAKSEELGHHVVELISRDDATASALCSVLYHDYHTFTHSANVAYYCVMLAKEAGIDSPEALRQVAVGAMLHDLGKLQIPDAILTKPGELTDDEFSIVQTHPTVGFRKLARRTDLSDGQLMMVYQHHERLNGTGYPVRISGDQMHYWAKICAVVDVFEALTSTRPYRSGMSMEAAFQIMDRQAGPELDQEIYELWKALMQKRS